MKILHEGDFVNPKVFEENGQVQARSLEHICFHKHNSQNIVVTSWKIPLSASLSNSERIKLKMIFT